MIKNLFVIICICYINSQNVIANHNFTHYLAINKTDYSSTLLGWICNKICQIKQCNQLKKYLNATTITSGNYHNCTGNYIDLDSNNQFQALTQLMSLTQPIYILEINYFYPRLSNHAKNLYVFFNNQVVFTTSTLLTYPKIPFMQKAIVQVKVKNGINNLTITMNASTQADGYGFYLLNISMVTKKKQKIMQNIAQVLQHQSVQTYVKIPGARILLSNFVMVFVNFDRLELYLFHDRDYPAVFVQLLKTIQKLKGKEDLLFYQIINYFYQNKTKPVDEKVEELNFKKKYYSSVSSKRVSERFDDFEDGFVSNFKDFLLYRLPLTIFIFLFLRLCFHVTRKWPISLFFRKYCFGVTLVMMIVEGKIEQLSFFLTGQCLGLFNFNYVNKIQNSLYILLFGIILIVSFSFLVFSTIHYRKKIKYLVDNMMNGRGLWASTIDRGIICVAFGIVHRAFLSSPSLQLGLLFFLEMIWVLTRIKFIRSKEYKNRFLAIIWVVQGLQRMALQVLFYFYGLSVSQRGILEDITIYCILAYVCIIGLEIIISLFEFLTETKSFFAKYYFKSIKITSIQNQQKNKKKKEKENLLEVNAHKMQKQGQQEKQRNSLLKDILKHVKGQKVKKESKNISAEDSALIEKCKKQYPGKEVELIHLPHYVVNGHKKEHKISNFNPILIIKNSEKEKEPQIEEYIIR